MNLIPFHLPWMTMRTRDVGEERRPVLIVDEPEPGSTDDLRYFPHRYAIPGVATIGSQVRLPELDWFRDKFLRGPFDIEITSGRVGRLRTRTRLTRKGAKVLQYEEHLGAGAANFRLEQADGCVRVTVSPMLARSPHVLYTNVIEALLRFQAVSRGMVLLHNKAKPAGVKGIYLRKVSVSSTMGAGVRIDAATLAQPAAQQ